MIRYDTLPLYRSRTVFLCRLTTSTNDTVMLFASGRKGRPADLAQFEDDVRQVCEELMLQMARDAEGMTKLVVIRITGAADGRAHV